MELLTLNQRTLENEPIGWDTTSYPTHSTFRSMSLRQAHTGLQVLRILTKNPPGNFYNVNTAITNAIPIGAGLVSATGWMRLGVLIGDDDFGYGNTNIIGGLTIFGYDSSGTAVWSVAPTISLSHLWKQVTAAGTPPSTVQTIKLQMNAASLDPEGFYPDVVIDGDDFTLDGPAPITIAPLLRKRQTAA